MTYKSRPTTNSRLLQDGTLDGLLRVVNHEKRASVEADKTIFWIRNRPGDFAMDIDAARAL